MDRPSAAVAFEAGAIDPREDSFRYLNGTPHIPALYACRPDWIFSTKLVCRDPRKIDSMTTRLIEAEVARLARQHSGKSRGAHVIVHRCPHAY